MNYFGHAVIAAQKHGSNEFVFGAMLPDLATMCGFRLGSAPPSELLEGILFHQQTDSLFHQTATFVEQNRLTLLAMRTAGIRRGPARAAAHIGVEMLIDAALAQSAHHFLAYDSALAWAEHSPHSTRGFAREDAQVLRSVCAHLRSQGPEVFHAAASRLTFRLGRTLEGRPRLAPSAQELVQMGAICAAAVERVSTAVPALLQELAPLLHPPSE